MTPDGGQELDSLVDLSEWEEMEYPQEEEFSISNSDVTKSKKDTTSGNGFFKVRTLNNEKVSKTESSSSELGNSSNVSDNGWFSASLLLWRDIETGFEKFSLVKGSIIQ